MDQSDLDLLQMVPAYHLQSVLKTRHLPLSWLALTRGTPVSNPASSLPPAVLQELARQLFAPAAVADVLAQLEPLDAAILRELVACGGRANSRDLAFYFSRTGLFEPGKKTENANGQTDLPESARSPRSTASLLPLPPPQYQPAHPHGVFEQALRRLLVLGLLFWGRQSILAGRDYTSGIHDGVLAVPVAVRAGVRETWPLDEKPLLTEVPSDPEVGEAARSLQRSLYLYWSLVAATRDGLTLVSSGLLARSALRQVCELFGARDVRNESEIPRLLFLRQLLLKLGLVQTRRNALVPVPAAAEAFFALPLLERARRCYHLYLENPFWNEMCYLPEINVRPGPSPLEPAHEEVVRSRLAVIDRLEREQPETWHDISAFIARTRLHIPYILFPRQSGPRAERYSSGSNPYGWDFRLRRGWLTHREGWHMVEGGFMRAIIGGPLFWLGIVELDHEDNPGFFRFTPGAATILTSSASLDATPEVWGRLVVQPNFDLVALAPVSEALLLRLDHFADRVSLELIAQYRLCKASVTRAIQRGGHAGEIQRMLEDAAGGPIPQNVSYSLGEWERQARRVELWPDISLLEVAEESQLDALFADEQTRPLLGRRLSPLLAEVPSYHFASLQTALWQRDSLPALTPARATGGASDSREPQWRLREDGLLEPCNPVLDLYLVAEAYRFCDHISLHSNEREALAPRGAFLNAYGYYDEATDYFKLTRPALQRALAEGMELSAIVRFLQQYCDGGIPPSLLIRLKLWGDGYGNLQALHIEHAPLLRLPANVLRDLQADDEVASLLGGEVEQQSRLVRVEPENLERVVELLRERGFAVE